MVRKMQITTSKQQDPGIILQECLRKEQIRASHVSDISPSDNLKYLTKINNWRPQRTKFWAWRIRKFLSKEETFFSH